MVVGRETNTENICGKSVKPWDSGISRSKGPGHYAGAAEEDWEYWGVGVARVKTMKKKKKREQRKEDLGSAAGE